jgi:DNA-binding NtrC family response regulator
MNFSGKENNSRILVVDDEEDVLEFLSIFLSSMGWEVVASPSPARALEELARRTFFMVLTDIAMPEMDGYEFVNTVRERKIPSEIALMTGFGYNPKHTLVKIRKSMQPFFFFKPFNRTKVSEGVQRAWAAYHRDFLVRATEHTLPGSPLLFA